MSNSNYVTFLFSEIFLGEEGCLDQVTHSTFQPCRTCGSGKIQYLNKKISIDKEFLGKMKRKSCRKDSGIIMQNQIT